MKKERNRSIPIVYLGYRQVTCHETSMETVHALLDVNLQNYLFSRGEWLAVFDRREQERKLNAYMLDTNRNAIL